MIKYGDTLCRFVWKYCVNICTFSRGSSLRHNTMESSWAIRTPRALDPIHAVELSRCGTLHTRVNPLRHKEDLAIGNIIMLYRTNTAWLRQKGTYHGVMFFKTLPDSLKKFPYEDFKKSLWIWVMKRTIYSMYVFLLWWV